jgi:hypothetical protein
MTVFFVGLAVGVVLGVLGTKVLPVLLEKLTGQVNKL